MPKQHEFELVVGADRQVTSVPSCDDAEIFVGDTVKFRSNFGKVKIDWTKNIFDKRVYNDGEVAKVVSVGDFSGLCTFTKKDGTTLQWQGSGTEGKSKEGEGGDDGTPS
jgi:hypothetical protein